MKQPTISDVAALAGVSPAAVSFVLNGRHAEMRISEEKRQLILEAIERLDYRPNASARELRTRRSHLIALAVHDIQNPYYAALAVAAQEEAAAAGYDVIIYNTGHQPEREHAFFSLALRRRVDGIFTSSMSGAPGVFEPLVRAGVPVVSLSNVDAVLHPHVDYLVDDDRGAAESAVRHLIELGHTRIGHLAGTLSRRAARARLEGYQAALDGADLPRDSALEVEGTLMAYGSGEAAAKLLDVRPRPTAIFCANDAMALQVHFLVRQRGLRIPQDLALVGFDDIPEASWVDPPLTTVANRSDAAGKRAVQLLLERVTGASERPPQIIHRPLPLIVRRSTVLEEDREFIS